MRRGRARVPVLIRLTATFAVATLLVLSAAALFVGVRLRADIDERIDVSLQRRAQAAETAYDAGTPMRQLALTLEDREEFFVQILTRGGDVLETGGTLAGPALTPDEAVRVERGLPMMERDLPGVDGRARLLVRPIELRSGAPGALVVGQSLVDRNDALDSVGRSFLIGGVIGLFLASALGYGVARAGLRPVEEMRRKAQSISLSGSTELLPLPPAHDQLRRLGETLNDMLHRLRDSFDREQRFVADASHEIRTPLATIRLELDSALRGELDDDDRRAALLAAHAECLRLTRLADDLLVLARLDGGRLPLRRSSFDVSICLTQLRDQYAARSAGLGRRLELDAPPGLWVDADLDRIAQLVANLVDNALRYGAGVVRVVARPVANGVELSVGDDGPGLPPEFLARAFERFSQADASRGAGGAGLGLALVAAIAGAHGGWAAVYSDHPSLVRVWIPAPGGRARDQAGMAGSQRPLIPGS